jgi:outer membrane protein TolC
MLAAAGCVRYEPRPVDPAAHPRAYLDRRLNDPALTDWIARHGGAMDTARWTDRRLALAALALRSDVERARRDWLTAGAGVRTAGARPAPGAEAAVERAVSGSESSPWVVSLEGLFTIELGGKRGARVQAARGRQVVAESDLLLAAHSVRTRVRAAALALAHATQVRDEAEAALAALREVDRLERGRYQEAALGSAELARTGAELALARADVAAAKREYADASAALAGELAVPAAALAELRVEVPPIAGCAWADSIGSDPLAAAAALRRAEVARALGRYAVAEAEVRMQVARQYPDLQLGPGFIWDQGIERWTLAFALPALLGFRNRAPIDEAQAARASAAAGVREAQDMVLAEASRAVEGCRAVSAERAGADSVAAAAERVASLARAAYQRGETGRLDGARAELARIRAGAAVHAAARRLELAGLAVEAAAGEWRGQAGEAWPDPRQPGPAATGVVP